MRKTLLIYLPARLPAFASTDTQVERLRHACPELDILHCNNQEEFVRNISKAHFILCYTFSPMWLQLTYRLKWMATPAAGQELLGCTVPERILLTRGAFHGSIIAETVLAMVLAVNRGLLPGLALQSIDNPWADCCPNLRTLHGTRATILGYGKIGQAIEAALTPLGVTCTGVNRSNFSMLNDLLPHTDHLILALPIHPSTDNLIDADRLALLPAHAALYNVGRGNSIVESALATALSRGVLHAACLDVMQEEPYPITGLLQQTPHCYLYPHCSAVAPHYIDLAFEEWLTLYHESAFYTPEE